MADNMTQRVSIQDSAGKYGRMRFVSLFKDHEWSALRHLAISSLGQPVVDTIDSLPRSKDTNDLGWWLPRDFQVKPCETILPEGTRCSREGLGWLAAVKLRKSERLVISFLDAYADQNEIGRRRKEHREYNEELYQSQPGQGIKLDNPFEGGGAIKRMLDAGAKVSVESPDQFLEMQSVVVYSFSQDAYLTQQGMWKGLNRARQFVSVNEADDYIKNSHLIDCMTATIQTRVEQFSRPELIGPKAAAAMNHRNALSDALALEEALPESNAISKPARRM